MKIKRSKKNYGGGSGRTIFESDLFTVIEWHLREGIQTVINCELNDSIELRFNGKHEFLSDTICMEQLTCKEILRIIKDQKKESFEAGKQYKINEVKKCLNIYEY